LAENSIVSLKITHHRMTGTELESLTASDSALPSDQNPFVSRHTCDVIVMLDEKSTSLGNSSSASVLNRIIYELEFKKVPKQAPLFLSGGFEAFSAFINTLPADKRFPIASVAKPSESSQDDYHKTAADYVLF
jgi:hypothetical protein